MVTFIVLSVLLGLSLIAGGIGWYYALYFRAHLKAITIVLGGPPK